MQYAVMIVYRPSAYVLLSSPFLRIETAEAMVSTLRAVGKPLDLRQAHLRLTGSLKGPPLSPRSQARAASALVMEYMSTTVVIVSLVVSTLPFVFARVPPRLALSCLLLLPPVIRRIWILNLRSFRLVVKIFEYWWVERAVCMSRRPVSK
jgi:hypothetical protein